MSASGIILVCVAGLRLFELWLSARHEKALRAKGAFEIGAAHYPAIVALHTGWLAGLFYMAWNVPVAWSWFALFLLLQVARIWTLRTLGERWTTRIIVLPDAPLVTGGPYRYVRHPNYMIVAGEIAILPLALGLPLYAFMFSVANAILLTIRIQSEDEALGQLRGQRAKGSMGNSDSSKFS